MTSSAEPLDQSRPIGLFATWWRGDELPRLPPLPGFASRVSDDAALVARVSGLERAAVQARTSRGHRPYLAEIGSEVVGYGWSATQEAGIGEIGLHLALPGGNRYLWDFVTLPAWRGREVYPHLLQAILRRESTKAERFWVGYDWDNHASARGVAKAGFQVVGELHDGPNGLGLVALERPERAEAAARLFGLPILQPRPGQPRPAA